MVSHEELVGAPARDGQLLPPHPPPARKAASQAAEGATLAHARAASSHLGEARALSLLRQPMVPGERYVPLPQPGFRWNVLDYGGPNTISSPLRNSRRCGDLGVALAMPVAAP